MPLIPPPPHKTCGCGRAYSLAEWLLLPLIGLSDLEADGDLRLEQRNCPCGSTIGVDLGAKLPIYAVRVAS